MTERHTGSYRRRNDSLAWRALEEQLLDQRPTCEHCGAPAAEAHRRGGCFAWLETFDGFDLDDAEALCIPCHDVVCDTRTKRPHEHAFERATG
jgi:hypothetical protein